MDQQFLRERDSGSKWNVLLIIFGIIVLVITVVLFIMKGDRKIISPIPPKPDFEVIFQTPVPSFTEPTSTPSATPKLKKAVSTITVKPSTNPTSNPSLSPTKT
jgi:hypothetical protein